MLIRSDNKMIIIKIFGVKLKLIKAYKQKKRNKRIYAI